MLVHEWTSIAVDGADVRAHITLPDAAVANGCGAVIMHGVNGLEDGYLDFPLQLAAAGYASILPDMFHRYDDVSRIERSSRVPGLTWAGVQADLESGRQRLQSHGVRRAAVMGYCFGGTASIMAAALMEFDAGVMFYPHSLFQPFGTGPLAPADLIPQLRVPLLGHFGADDRNPTVADMQRLDEALTAAGTVHALYSYPGAGHGFAAGGAGRTSYRELQAMLANARTIEWFDGALRDAIALT
jgi:carboxymethylenebutenolidase